jgi:hypothetical protein
MSGIPYIDAYIRAFRTQALRNGLDISYGYYTFHGYFNSSRPNSISATVIPFFDAHVPSPRGPVPWSFAGFMDQIVTIPENTEKGAPEVIFAAVAPESYHVFSEWIETAAYGRVVS